MLVQERFGAEWWCRGSGFQCYGYWPYVDQDYTQTPPSALRLAGENSYANGLIEHSGFISLAYGMDVRFTQSQRGNSGPRADGALMAESSRRDGRICGLRLAFLLRCPA